MKLFEVASPSTIKEASKMEKVRNKFRPARMRTSTLIVSFSLRANLGTIGPLYLLGNIQTGKSKKKFELSWAAQANQKRRLRPYLYKEHPDGKK